VLDTTTLLGKQPKLLRLLDEQQTQN